ncbi:MAG: hypothetical protein MZV65_17150 [Chromatiales bacterium]|nr:hypothetical protein [Chromatiales bacterium]
MTLFFLVAGLALLVLGAEWLVKGASGLAAAAGVFLLVIGLTVVAFGTSSPELADVRERGLGLQGKLDLAVDNVVGSNILNVLLILGVSAAIMPLAVQRQLIRLDVPIMIGVSVLVLPPGPRRAPGPRWRRGSSASASSATWRSRSCSG